MSIATPQTTRRAQRVQIPPAGQELQGSISVYSSPITDMRALQVAVEGAHETVEQLHWAEPISGETADRILQWVTEDSLDWDHLIESDDGWGMPDH